MPAPRPDAPPAAPAAAGASLPLADPVTVAIGSPEFDAAVSAAVARAVAALPPAPPPPPAPEVRTVAVQQPVVIQQTSIDTTQPGLDDLTVQFTRFCTFQNCGYQRGSQAGFPREAAERLHRSGSAFIVHDPRAARRAA